jgi:formate hydrogenlyase transcriptional activator
MSDLLSVEEYRVLLAVSQAIVAHRDLHELFHDLAGRLRQVVRFDHLLLVLHDEANNLMRRHVLETSASTPVPLPQAMPVGEGPGGSVWQTQQPVVIADLAKETRWPRFQEQVKGSIVSLCELPLTTARRRLGALGFGSREANVYDAADLAFMQQVANQVAVAVENALNFQNAQDSQGQLAQERDRLRVLLEINNAVVAQLDLRELFHTIGAFLQQVVQQDYTSLTLYDQARHQLRVHALDFPGGKGLVHEELVVPFEGSPASRAFATRQPVVLQEEDLRQLDSQPGRTLLAEGIRSFCSVPLISRDRLLGSMNVGRRQNVGFTPGEIDLLTRVAVQVALAVENALAFDHIKELKEKLEKEKVYLEEEIKTQHNFEEIIGESPMVKRVLKEVETVAVTNSTVLIKGETGTGKELIARALHHLSPRRDRTFVKLNCAAIPTGLLESELFGHEKGAFTGAITQKVGRFELANQGTLFLDEVGDISPELQPKLLRVLQEQEFERLGSTRTIRVDVRLVAATNVDLARRVADGQFRSDLYYRLNVFPVLLPPLRERRQDIPLLVRHFTGQFARRMGKRIEHIPANALDVLVKYPWPGNIRELQNVIERAVILSPGPELHIVLDDFKPGAAPAEATTTLEDAEREHIRRVLQEANWVLAGPNGAAARLGMKRSTLQWKMKKLGISRPR